MTSISPRVSKGNPEKLCNFGQQFDPTADDSVRSVPVRPSNSETATSQPRWPFSSTLSMLSFTFIHTQKSVSLTVKPTPFNILKTKRNLLYIGKQSVPRCKHFPPRMTYKAKVAVCSEIRTKLLTQGEQHVKFFNVKPVGT